MKTPDPFKPLESLEGTEQARVLRALLWRHRRQWTGELIAHPSAVTAEARCYAAGGAAALETLYDEIGKLLKWRVALVHGPSDPPPPDPASD